MTLHQKLVKKWTSCQFGVKQRVFNDAMPQTSVQYILSNPKYGDVSKIESLIKCIEKHAKAVEDEAHTMAVNIRSI